MVFFLTRAALCIGIVAVVAGGGGAGRLATAIDRGARDGLAGAGRACLASSACLRIGTAAVSAATVPIGEGAETSGARPDEPPRRAAAPPRSEPRSIRRAAVAGG